MDIHNKEFKKSVRGYDQEEVDEFLDEIIIDYEQMQRELELLREQVNTYSDNMTMYRERENALNNALISAQQFADNIKKDAEFSARKIVEDAKREAESIVGSTEARLSALQESYEKLLERYNGVRANVCDYLKAQMEMIQGQNLDQAYGEVFVEQELFEDAQETKINEKIKELMDSKIYK